MAVSRIPASSISIVLCFAIAASLAGVAQSLACGGTSENLCPSLAYCSTTGQCVCDAGAIGDGNSCTKNGWTVRYNVQLPDDAAIEGQLSALLYNSEARYANWDADAGDYAALMFDDVNDMPGGFVTSMYHALDMIDIGGTSKLFIVINAVFETKQAAEYAAANLTASIQTESAFGVKLSDVQFVVEPRVYSWTLATTSSALQIAPTGLNVDAVSFDPTCNSSRTLSTTGCWVIDITYTTGVDSFNTLFIPRAVLPADFSYDSDYDYASMANPSCDPEACRDAVTGKRVYDLPGCSEGSEQPANFCTQAELNYLNWQKTALDTFTASNFPCGSSDYDPANVHIKKEWIKKPRVPSPPDEVTSCCLPEFFDMYRPIEAFQSFFAVNPVNKTAGETDADISRIRIRKDRCDGGQVEMWHKPSWPVVNLEVPIPPRWSNDGSWTEINCVREGGGTALWHSKLNSRDAPDSGFYFQAYGNPSASTPKGYFDNYVNCTERDAAQESCDECATGCETGCNGDYGGCLDPEGDLPYKDGQFQWMKEDTCWKLSDDILRPENVFYDGETLPDVELRKIQGKIDMGCYDNGEVMSWVIQPETDWTISFSEDGTTESSVFVSSIFGEHETPVVILDVLTLSLEDENDDEAKISDRWDVLQVGVCDHGGYIQAYRDAQRKVKIQECLDVFGGAYSPPEELWPEDGGFQQFCGGESCFFQNVNDNDETQQQPGPKGFFTWAKDANEYVNANTANWYDLLVLGTPKIEMPADSEDEYWFDADNSFKPFPQPWKQLWDGDGYPFDPSKLQGTFLADMTAEALLAAVEAGEYNGMSIPGDVTCPTKFPSVARYHAETYGEAWEDGIRLNDTDVEEAPVNEADCLWNKKFCTALVDFTVTSATDKDNLGYGDAGRPAVHHCADEIWETGKVNPNGAPKYDKGVTMPVQSGVRKGFRVVACTGSAIVKFISDAHSAHSTGFTIDYIVVPASELHYWTGEELGFDQGGWTCPTYPFRTESQGVSSGDDLVITDEMVLLGDTLDDQKVSPDGTKVGNPYTVFNKGMVFKPPVGEVVGQWYDNANAFCDADLIAERFGVEMEVPAMQEIPPNYMTGEFAGMDSAWVEFGAVVDPFIRQYQARVYLDDEELREKAGQLRGTVGVEYSIDTFIGMANFNPTNSKFLDPAGYQIALHLEKTNFFTVSTYGTNEYTFLEYVNLRLVTILQADASLLTETDAEFEERTGQIASGNEVQYVQVTFTLGSKYAPHSGGLIPLDSVVVSKGTFISAPGGTRQQTCTEWSDNSFTEKEFFTSTLDRDCAPNADMCVSPSDIPDNFVSFNIPLGKDYLPDGDAVGSTSVFVEMVVSADDTTEGADPKQMKTTLTGSIPVVVGGENVFCDGIFAKTDLKDVVNMDIIFGSANDVEEISDLTILTNVGSTDLQQETTQSFQTDSIESGLMTLVAKGDAAYFGLGGTTAYKIQLEDVITIHIMEADNDNTVFDKVKDMIATAGDDNRDTSGEVDTDGYNLNNAFKFVIDRAANRAHLHPTQALLDECPYRPQRPDVAGAFPPTCVTRRDIKEQIAQTPTGSSAALAMEVDIAGGPGNQAWMQSVFGESDYASTLGQNFALAIASKYGINNANINRYTRAWWINPGYEWTPSQTFGKSIFSISQKIILFALVNLDEGLVSRRSGSRRAVLSSVTDNTGAGVGTTAVVFKTSPQSLMAKVYAEQYPNSVVETFEVTTKLTNDQACMDKEVLRSTLNDNFNDWITGTVEGLVDNNVQVTKVTVDRPASVSCSRRRSISRKLLQQTGSDATATAEMLLVFEDSQGKFDQEAFKSRDPGILEMTGGSGTISNIPVNTRVKQISSSGGDNAGSSVNMGLIIGCVVGGVAFLVVAAAFIYRAVRGGSEEDFTEVAGVTVRDLKAQLTMTPGQVPNPAPSGSQTSQQMAEYLEGSMGSRNASAGYAY